MTDENLLSKIRGDDVGRALNALPKCTAESPATTTITIAIDGIGLVRFTAKRLSHSRGRIRHYFWTAETAVAAGPQGAPGAKRGAAHTETVANRIQSIE